MMSSLTDRSPVSERGVGSGALVGSGTLVGTGGSPAFHLSESDRTRLRELITRYSGLDASIYTDDVLESAVARRLAVCRLNHFEDYWRLIQSAVPGLPSGGSGPGDGEINRLVQILTNKETFLFREMHHFEVLRDQVLPELLAASSRPLRLWSAGCATGEEPYSLAITLLEYQAQHGPFEAYGGEPRIVGTDIDEDALRQARQGCYGERSLRLVPDEWRQRYFTFDGRRYCVRPEVARLVTFRVHNLAEECCPADLQNLDIVFCRNVTIYFDQEARDRLNARLASSLREGGYLFVASAETIGHNVGRLELVAAGKAFLFCKGTPAIVGGQARGPVPTPTAVGAWSRRPSSPVPTHNAVGAQSPRTSPPTPAHSAVGARSPRPSSSPPPPAAVGAPSPRPLVEGLSPLHQAQQAFQRQDYGATLHHLGRLPADLRTWPKVQCLQAAALLQQERLDEAEAACQYLLAGDLWHADAHLLLGLVARQRNLVEEAIQSLRQAIYLQPNHRDAHFCLAEIYRSLGLVDQAQREYENTLNILGQELKARSAGPSPDLIESVSLIGLSDEIVRTACELNLKRLGNRA